jgi:hypothetical protein
VPQSSPPIIRLPASLCLGLALAGPLIAQSAVRLASDVPLLKDPGGVTLASLNAGTRVVPGRASGEFVEITLHGWIFTASTRAEKREGFDLAATTAENIRAEPDGAVLARTSPGALLTRVTRRGGWTEVRRTGWVRRSLLATAPARKPVAVQTTPPPRTPVVTAKADTQRPPASLTPVPAATPASRVKLRSGAALSRAPDGASLGTLSGSADASVEERNGDWVRVRIDAWLKRGDILGPLEAAPAITAAMVRDNPEKYVGQIVQWRVQFLAHQKADELRPEMPPGHPYLLTRGPLPETGFVYVLLSREQADQLQGLKPLDELSLTATVRSARTRYLATPVVELVKLGR